MKVKIQDAPKMFGNLARGKEYEVVSDLGLGRMTIIDDDDNKIIIKLKGCHQLGGGSWEVLSQWESM